MARAKLYIMIKNGEKIELMPFKEWVRQVKPETARKQLERADTILLEIHGIRRGRKGRKKRFRF